VTVRILLDAFWWAAGPMSNRQVQRELIWHWALQFPQDELVLAVRRRDLERAQKDLPPGARAVASHLYPHGLAAILEYPLLARRVHADVIVNHNFAPAWGPSAIFVHDVLFQTDPAWFTRVERAYFSLMPFMFPRADVIVTSSRNEAARIGRANPRLRPVVPIGLAVGTTLTRAVPVRPAAAAGLDTFVLSVGRLNVRKNLAVAFEAALRSGEVTSECPLLVVGEREGVRVALSPAIRDAVDRGAIRFAGFVTDGELAWLYAHARLFVFLSLDEGFGLPPLEALSFGCPVLVSDLPVFHETLGEQATYADPRDVDAAATQIARLVRTATRVSDPVLPDWNQCARRLRAEVVGVARATSGPRR